MILRLGFAVRHIDGEIKMLDVGFQKRRLNQRISIHEAGRLAHQNNQGPVGGRNKVKRRVGGTGGHIDNQNIGALRQRFGRPDNLEARGAVEVQNIDHAAAAGNKFEAERRGRTQVNERGLILQHVAHVLFRVDAEQNMGIGDTKISVEQTGAVSHFGKRQGDINRDARLADPALTARNCY